VQFIAADRTDTFVEVQPADASKNRDVKAAAQTEVGYSGGVLQIEALARKRLLRASGSTEITVQLPAGSRIEAKTDSVEFRAFGRLGDVVFEGSDSAIELDEVESARLITLAGDISVGRLGGPGEINTAKGDIRISEAVRGTVVLRTQAGDVSIGAAAGASAFLEEAGTTRGRIHNALNNTEGAVDLDIHATTDHGDIVARSL
jgi:DUF4097 and DUF4098 domain-containing protein YvlB